MPINSSDRFYYGANLPHCEANGRPQMITLRQWDSLPREVFRSRVQQMREPAKARLYDQRYLDEGRGSCLLGRADVARIVEGALQHYDGERYQLLDWVVMPNHVHVVYDKPKAEIGQIIRDWKGYTARMINRLLGRTGPFWQADYFDRFARDEQHLSRMSAYTILNPVHAGLVDDPFRWPHSSIHRYPPEFKDQLRRWYRAWKDRYWQSVG